MFSQLPAEEESHTTKTTTPKKKHKRKPRRNKAKKVIKKKDCKFANSMSAWAENFAKAAAWQLKHQVAYWKARAKALEYENSVLHDVIRRNNCVIRSGTNTESQERMESERDSDSQSEQSEENEDEDFEVSEEFIQFLTANAKFKEDARQERERLKAQSELENQPIVEPRETVEESTGRMKELYGVKWQRISALEMSLLISFLNESDESKPDYWPNVPFNFNY